MKTRVTNALQSPSGAVFRSRKGRPDLEQATRQAPQLAVRSILVPTDFSDCSKQALRYAEAFAKTFGGKLTVLNVVKPYVPVPEATMVDVGMIERNLRQTAQLEMTGLQEELAGQQPFRPVIRSGNPAIEIVKEAKRHDLIIIATHGRTGIGHWLLGSTAEKVVRHAPCPVLVVRQRGRSCLSALPPRKKATMRKKVTPERA